MKKYLLFSLILGLSFIFSNEVYGLSKLTKSGIELYWRGKDLNYATQILNDGLKMPHRTDAQKSYIYLFLGRIALAQGKLSEADINFDKSMILYSNPYPYLIYTEYYQNNNDLEKAKYFLEKGLNWYEARTTELLEDSFDITQLHFWSRACPLDNSLDDYEIYKVMYDSKAPKRLRWLTYLQFCLASMSELRKLGVQHGYLSPSEYTFYNIDTKYNVDNAFTETVNEELETHKYSYWFQDIIWSGNIQATISLFKNEKMTPFKLSVDISQQKNGVPYVATKLALLCQIDENRKCSFAGADGKLYPLPLLNIIDNSLVLNCYYKVSYPAYFSDIEKQEIFSQKLYLDW